jgi:hypothetical protein
MTQAERNPSTCTKSVIIDGEDSRYAQLFGGLINPPGADILALIECERWPFLPSTLRSLTGSTSVVVRSKPRQTRKDLLEELGTKCGALCSQCELFSPRVRYPSDPEYTPGPDVLGGEATFAPGGSGPVSPIQAGTN